MNQPIGEDGNPTIAGDFDYDAIDGPADVGDDNNIVSSYDFFMAANILRKLLTWQYQDGIKDPNGKRIREIIVQWLFLKELHHYSMSELARKHGLHKQSIGRWVDDFKRAFPDAKTEHMR